MPIPYNLTQNSKPKNFELREIKDEITETVTGQVPWKQIGGRFILLLLGEFSLNSSIQEGNGTRQAGGEVKLQYNRAFS